MRIFEGIFWRGASNDSGVVEIIFSAFGCGVFGTFRYKANIIMRPSSYRPHYAFCSSVWPSVSLFPYRLVTRKNVAHGVSIHVWFGPHFSNPASASVAHTRCCSFILRYIVYFNGKWETHKRIWQGSSPKNQMLWVPTVVNPALELNERKQSQLIAST